MELDNAVENASTVGENKGQIETLAEDTKGSESSVKEKGFKAFLSGLFGADRGADTAEEGGSEDTSTSENEKQIPDYETMLEKRLAEEKQKWIEEQQKKVEFEKLSAEEKAEALAAEKDEKIRSLEKIILEGKLREDVIGRLSKEGYPVRLAEMFAYTDAERVDKDYETLTSVFKQCLSEAVSQKLKRKTPEGLETSGTGKENLRNEIAKSVRGGF